MFLVNAIDVHPCGRAADRSSRRAVVASLDSIPAPVQMLCPPVSTMVQSRIDSIAHSVQMGLKPIAAPIQALGALRFPSFERFLGASIQALIDPIAFRVEALIDAVACSVQALVQVLAVLIQSIVSSFAAGVEPPVDAIAEAIVNPSAATTGSAVPMTKIAAPARMIFFITKFSFFADFDNAWTRIISSRFTRFSDECPESLLEVQNPKQA